MKNVWRSQASISINSCTGLSSLSLWVSLRWILWKEASLLDKYNWFIWFMLKNTQYSADNQTWIKEKNLFLFLYYLLASWFCDHKKLSWKIKNRLYFLNHNMLIWTLTNFEGWTNCHPIKPTKFCITKTPHQTPWSWKINCLSKKNCSLAGNHQQY